MFRTALKTVLDRPATMRDLFLVQLIAAGAAADFGLISSLWG